MRRHCRNDAFKIFEYLLTERIMKTKDGKFNDNLIKILTSRDKDGYTLLHCAAEGGSIDIIRAIIKSMNQVNETFKIKIDDTTYDGRTVLHFACKNKHFALCRELLVDSDYKHSLLHKTSKQEWNAAHFAAVGGDKHIMDILHNKNLDIKIETGNGLNILDIACIHNHIDLFKDLLGQKSLNLPLNKSDARGWTIAHFAAMVGNTIIFDSLIENKLEMVRTKDL